MYLIVYFDWNSTFFYCNFEGLLRDLVEILKLSKAFYVGDHGTLLQKYIHQAIRSYSICEQITILLYK